LRLRLDHVESLHAIETAEIIVAASGDTQETEGRSNDFSYSRPAQVFNDLLYFG